MTELFFEHPILTFLLAYLLTGFVTEIWRRLNSTIKISVRGWPPGHLDADGDWKPKSDSETEQTNGSEG